MHHPTQPSTAHAARLGASLACIGWPLGKILTTTKPLTRPRSLSQHDLPHASSSLEWWYHNAHITTTCGKEITLFSSFFRLVTGYNEETKTLEYGHGA